MEFELKMPAHEVDVAWRSLEQNWRPMWLNVSEILSPAEMIGGTFSELLKSYGIPSGRKLKQEHAKP